MRAHTGWRHDPFEDRFGYELSRLARVWRVVRSVDGGVPASAFTDGYMRVAMRDVSGVLSNTADLLREAEVLPLLDREYDLMAEVLRLEWTVPALVDTGD